MKNAHHVSQSPRSSNVLFCAANGPKSKDVHFLIVEDEEKPTNIYIWEAGLREMTQIDKSIMKTVAY